MSGDASPTKKIWKRDCGEDTPEYIVNERNDNLRQATLESKTELEKAWHMGRAEWFQKRLLSSCPIPERSAEEIQCATQRYLGRSPTEVYLQFVYEKRESDALNRAMKNFSLNEKPDKQKGKHQGGRGI